MVVSTCAYLFYEDEILFIHRNKKKNDLNSGYYIGIGGKKEPYESLNECIHREIKEETNYDVYPTLQAIVTFIEGDYEELMFLYKTTVDSKEIIDCDEGDLVWIKEKDIHKLNLWEGDYLFFDWFKQDKVIEAKFVYENKKLIEKIIYE